MLAQCAATSPLAGFAPRVTARYNRAGCRSRVSARRHRRGGHVAEQGKAYVGAALSPRETRKLVAGRGSYIGDLTAPGLLHAAFVRSRHAHARIGHIDVAAARRAPGVAAA